MDIHTGVQMQTTLPDKPAESGRSCHVPAPRRNYSGKEGASMIHWIEINGFAFGITAVLLIAFIAWLIPEWIKERIRR